MANMLGSKTTDNRVIKECWNATLPRTTYIRSQSERPASNPQESTYDDSKVSHAIQLPRNLKGPLSQKDEESSEKTTLINFPRHFSDLPNLPVLGDDIEQGNLKLRKTISSESIGLEKLVAVNIGSQKTPPKTKQEQKSLSNQYLKKVKAMPRRSSLPASYLENFLSVNNIRKRALSNASIESEDVVVPTNADGRLPSQNSTRKAKNVCRRKVKPNSNEDNEVSCNEVLETVVPTIEVHESVEKENNIEEDDSPKSTVSYNFVTLIFFSYGPLRTFGIACQPFELSLQSSRPTSHRCKLNHSLKHVCTDFQLRFGF